MSLQFLRICPVLLFAAFVTQAKVAHAVNTTFVIDEQASSLTIKATTVFGFTFMDTDTQNLGGTLDAELEFGASGTFPAMGELTVPSAAISPLNPFSLTLGVPPNFGVNVTVNDAVADVQTPSPPVTLTSLPTALVRYEFDASGFDIILDQGTMIATGAVNETIDLAESPVIGAADPGTLGQITFLNIDTVGPITQVDAQLELPITFAEVVDVDGQEVTLDVTGNVIANASFPLALSGLPGDFDNDVDVDVDDLGKWIAEYGGPGSDADADGVSDGDDFVIWQQQFGLGVPVAVQSAAVPEPASFVLALFTSLLLLDKRWN